MTQKHSPQLDTDLSAGIIMEKTKKVSEDIPNL